MRSPTAVLYALLLLASCSEPDPALLRGDRLWADSAHTAALAEYRLAVRQSESDEKLLRLAHAYVRTRQPEQARESYARLLSFAPEHRDQAVFDFLWLADEALARGDRQGMASAVDQVLALRPALQLPRFYLPLARHFARSGDRQRARDYYVRALSVAPQDSTPPLLFELGRLHEELGQCAEAVGFYDAYLEQARYGDRYDEARWRAGGCSWALARQAQEAGELQAALSHLGRLLSIGAPSNLLDQAWYQRGELFYMTGQLDRALDAFQRVLDLSPSRGGPLAERARSRIEQIYSGYAPTPLETPPPPSV